MKLSFCSRAQTTFIYLPVIYTYYYQEELDKGNLPNLYAVNFPLIPLIK